MGKKTWKILGIGVGLIVGLLLLFVVAFVYNPLEGSVADFRGLIPRNAEWFFRKEKLSDDFASFPEPKFWDQLEQSSAWQTLKRGPLVSDLDRDRQISNAVEQLRRAEQQMQESSGGFLSLPGDLIGEEVVFAGRFRGPDVGNTAFCAYLRVSWQVRFGWGLLEFLGPDTFGAGVPISQRDDGTLVMNPPNDGPPLFLARHLDCVMISNDEELLGESLQLASGTSDLESFASSSYYRDEISTRIGEWSEQTGVEQPNVIESFVRSRRLFELTRFDDDWPDPKHPESLSQRVLASFLRLDGWRYLTSSMVFEDGRLTVLGNVGMNQTTHTRFQQDFFRAEEGDRGEWLDLFLRTTPRNALAAAALRVPAGEFLQEMIRSLDPELRRTIDEVVQKTGQFDSADAVIADLSIALLPRLGVVFQQAREIGGGIETFEPSPAPHVAWVFWIDERFRSKVQNFYAFLERHAKTALGFEGAYDLPVLNSQGGDAAREYTNKNIPGTGEVAIMIYREFLVLSNSGPLIQDMIRARVKGEDLTENPDYQTFAKEFPERLNGFVFLQGEQLMKVGEDYVSFLESGSSMPDPSWMVSARPGAESAVLRAKFPGVRAVGQLTPQQIDAFEEGVQEELKRRWNTERQDVIRAELAAHEQTIALAKLLRSVCVEFKFTPESLRWKLGALIDYQR